MGGCVSKALDKFRQMIFTGLLLLTDGVTPSQNATRLIRQNPGESVLAASYHLLVLHDLPTHRVEADRMVIPNLLSHFFFKTQEIYNYNKGCNFGRNKPSRKLFN